MTGELGFPSPVGGDELLLAATELQDKIRAADLGQAKSASLEEQEAMEESGSYDGNAPVRPGEPVFLFVARVPEDVRAKALADALGKARAGAERLAKAATPDKELLPFVGPQSYRRTAGAVRRTLEAGPERRAGEAGKAITAAKKQKLTTAGIMRQ